MSDLTKGIIKTRSKSGDLVNLVDNPDKAAKVKMTKDQTTMSEASNQIEEQQEMKQRDLKHPARLQQQ